MAFFLCSCHSQSEHNKTHSASPPSDTAVDTPTTATTPSIISSPFLAFVAFLDSSGYLFDTVRMQKFQHYPELIRSTKFTENGYPFYYLSSDDHPIMYVLRGMLPYRNELPSPALVPDTSVYKKVRSIVGYCCYQKATKTDFVIEQWNFTTPAEAETANQEFTNIKSQAYFNTMSFSTVRGSTFYIFHSRAMSFSYELRALYAVFEKRF